MLLMHTSTATTPERICVNKVKPNIKANREGSQVNSKSPSASPSQMRLISVCFRNSNSDIATPLIAKSNVYETAIIIFE